MSAETDNPTARMSTVGVTVLGLGANVLLSVTKLAAGVMCSSQTILADGLHSLSDLVTDVAVLAGIRISGRPADESHPYGHRRVMTLVTAMLGVLLMTAGAFVVWQAVGAVHHGGPRSEVRAALPLALACASIVIKELLYRLTVRVGRRAGDTSVMANAWHHRSDALSSVAAAAGLSAVLLGGAKWQVLDQVTAMILACFLAVVAWRIIRGAGDELMDRAPSRRVLEQIEQAVGQTGGVRSFHAFRARKLGGMVEMDIHVQVDPELTVARGHDIATEVCQRVEDRCPTVINVIVHVEPVE
jgi:cation diffusion facilitator family transporter